MNFPQVWTFACPQTNIQGTQEKTNKVLYDCIDDFSLFQERTRPLVNFPSHDTDATTNANEYACPNFMVIVGAIFV